MPESRLNRRGFLSKLAAIVTVPVLHKLSAQVAIGVDVAAPAAERTVVTMAYGEGYNSAKYYSCMRLIVPPHLENAAREIIGQPQGLKAEQHHHTFKLNPVQEEILRLWRG